MQEVECWCCCRLWLDVSAERSMELVDTLVDGFDFDRLLPTLADVVFVNSMGVP